MMRCGTIVLAGRPNAGKSTLLNALVEQPLAIVSSKPQSTRLPVYGLRTDGDTQLIFVDPPGLLEPEYALQRSMITAAVEVLAAADALILVHPAPDGSPPSIESLLADQGAGIRLPRARATALTQADRAKHLPMNGPNLFVVSAVEGTGLQPLLDWCRGVVPESDFRYAADDVSTQP